MEYLLILFPALAPSPALFPCSPSRHPSFTSRPAALPPPLPQGVGTGHSWGTRRGGLRRTETGPLPHRRLDLHALCRPSWEVLGLEGWNPKGCTEISHRSTKQPDAILQRSLGLGREGHNNTSKPIHDMFTSLHTSTHLKVITQIVNMVYTCSRSSTRHKMYRHAHPRHSKRLDNVVPGRTRFSKFRKQFRNAPQVIAKFCADLQ